MSLTLRRAPLVLSIVAFAAGCATGGPPETETVPPPTETAAPEPGAVLVAGIDTLAPSDAALRTAEHVETTGLETGTMWTFENSPLEYWSATYGFTPDPSWLEHVRLSSVRYGRGCSASFVSPDGLVMTNHHCARGCVEAVSTAEDDYVVNGFLADERSQEKVCPGLFLDQLVEIEEVTDRVRGAVPEGVPDARAVAIRDSVSSTIAAECEASGEHRCQVVNLYHGGQYQLYTYRRYSPVKLVFAPELQAGFFGGDPDNFTYPRFALDVAFVRAYAPDSLTPAATPAHFEWDPDGADEEELVFITGNPGSTYRLSTVAQLVYERIYRHPFVILIMEQQRELLTRIAERGPEAERRVRGPLFGIENTLKLFRGELAGLRDTVLIGRKIKWERQFREQVEDDPTLHALYGDVWDRIARIQLDKMAASPKRNANNPGFLGGPYERRAVGLVRYVVETAKPESERLAAFRGDSLELARQVLAAAFEPDSLEAAELLALRLEYARRFLAAGDPFLTAALRPGETSDQAAVRLIEGTRIDDAGFRRRAMGLSPAELAELDDPLIQLARVMDRRHREGVADWEAASSAEAAQEERLADALFEVYGTDLPPDATFTLRISDGVVRRYEYNGTFAPPHTTFHGLYGRAAGFGNEMPWSLPASFEGKQDALELATPLDFVATTDITGGNSGSPMIDADARIVGIAFDGNVEQLPNEFLFSPERGRTVAVHSAGILEALRVIYEADALVREILGE
ncbi:MAG: S46 family peptidase [Gemmatimonadota bacterium]|nr:S46 family peptidase [Gemmatimonadota bacterium]